MSKAVQFDSYGGIDVLGVGGSATDSWRRPMCWRGQGGGITPGEAMIRQGFLHDRWPANLPSGQGVTWPAGRRSREGVDTFTVGDELLGFTDNRSPGQLVVVPAGQLTAKPAAVPWEVAGALYVAGTTAFAAVRSSR